MSSPSDKVWIFVKGRRSFKWKGSDLCPFHKSRLLLLSKGRCQKLRWANPFWSVTYCKKTVKFMQWTVISLSSILLPSSPSTLLLWHLGEHLDRRAAPFPTQPRQSSLLAGQSEVFLGGLCVERAPAVARPCILLLRQALHGDHSMAPLLRPSEPLGLCPFQVCFSTFSQT